jgi:hypothetical protein
LSLSLLAFANVNAQILDPVMDNKKIENISRHLCVDFDGIIEKTGMCIRSLPDGPLPLEVIFKTKR